MFFDGEEVGDLGERRRRRRQHLNVLQRDRHGADRTRLDVSVVIQNNDLHSHILLKKKLWAA